MIDIETAIYTRVREGVKAAYPSASISGIYTETPSAFPFVSFVEAANSAYYPTETLGHIENHAQVVYQADIYSNNVTQGKSACKGIASVIDEVMTDLGFRRTSAMQTPNIDRSLYRITMRFEGVISKGEQDGDTTRYSIYSS